MTTGELTLEKAKTAIASVPRDAYERAFVFGLRTERTLLTLGAPLIGGKFYETPFFTTFSASADTMIVLNVKKSSSVRQINNYLQKKLCSLSIKERKEISGYFVRILRPYMGGGENV